MGSQGGGVQRGLRGSGERGVTSLEYVGFIAVAAVVVSTVALGVVQGDVGTHVCKAIGSIFRQDLACAAGGSGGDDDATDSMTDENFEPEKCKLHEIGDKYSSAIKIGFVKIGENSGFVVATYSDGTVTMTATDGSELGAVAGVGADASWDKVKLGLKVDFGADVSFDYGSTWTFENQAQADAFKSQLNDYLYDQWAMRHPMCSGAMCVMPKLTGAEPPPVPSTSISGFATTGEVSLQLGVSRTTGEPEVWEDNPEQGEMTTLGVAGQLTEDRQWTITNDNNNTPDDASDDTRTYVTDLTLNTETTGQIALATGGTGEMEGLSYSITKDAKGNIIEVQIVSTSQVTTIAGKTVDGEKSQGTGDSKTSGGGSMTNETTKGDVVVTETTLVIDPSDTGAQQVVRDWMGGDGDFDYPGLVKLDMIDPSTADPSDPMSMLLHNKATSSTIAYDNVTDVKEFALNVKLGVALGVDLSIENSESTATEATYLGAPRPDGTRPVLDYTECVS